MSQHTLQRTLLQMGLYTQSGQSAHANLQRAHKCQNGTLLHHLDWWVVLQHLPEEVMALGGTVRSERGRGGDGG